MSRFKDMTQTVWQNTTLNLGHRFSMAVGNDLRFT